MDREPAATELEYVGFWLRVAAVTIDVILLILLTWPPLIYIYGPYFGPDAPFIHGFAAFLLSWILPAIVIIVFWRSKGATPGKMAISATIVDATSGRAPTTGKLIIRYLGYFVSTIPLGLGYIWVAFDSRKQGWHDKLANTVVVRPRHRGARPAIFED